MSEGGANTGGLLGGHPRRGPFLLPLALLAGVSLFTGCGGGAQPKPEPPPPAPGAPGVAARVEVEPRGALLTAVGEARQLTATAYDAAGNVVSAAFEWSSSSPAVTASGAGLVTAAAVGSAGVTASVGSVRSAPALVAVAEVALGTVLVTDAQVAAEPVPVDPSAPLVVGARTRMALSGVPAPPVGALLLGTGEKAVAGRVVSSEASGGAVTVTLERRPAPEYFRSLSVAYPAAERATRVEATSSRTLVLPPVSARANRTFDLKGFECRADGDTETLDSTITLSATRSLIIDPPIFEVEDFELKRLRLRAAGEVTLSQSGSLRLGRRFAGSLSCHYKFMTIPVPTPAGFLAALWGPGIRLGFDFAIEGELGVTTAELKVTESQSASVAVGFDYTPDQGLKNLSAVSSEDKTEPKFLTPDDPQVDLEAGLSLGLRVGAVFGGAFADLELLRVRAGPKLELDVRDASNQAKDPDYASSVALKVRSVAEAGDDVDAALDTVLSRGEAEKAKRGLRFELGEELVLARSPEATATMDNASFSPGGAVKFKVKFNPSLLTLFGRPVVKAVEVHRLSGSGTLAKVAEGPGDGAREEYELPWTADGASAAGDRFFAFARLNLAGLDSLLFELDEVEASGCPVAALTGIESATCFVEGKVKLVHSREQDGGRFSWEQEMTDLRLVYSEKYSSDDGSVLVFELIRGNLVTGVEREEDRYGCRRTTTATPRAIDYTAGPLQPVRSLRELVGDLSFILKDGSYAAKGRAPFGFFIRTDVTEVLDGPPGCRQETKVNPWKPPVLVPEWAELEPGQNEVRFNLAWSHFPEYFPWPYPGTELFPTFPGLYDATVDVYNDDFQRVGSVRVTTEFRFVQGFSGP